MNIFKKSCIAAFSIVFLIAAGCKDKKESGPAGASPRRAPGAMTVDAFVVKKQTVSESIQVPGSLLAFESTEIHPEVSGRLVLLEINEGRFVKKGTLLARIYDEDLTAQQKKLEVQLEIAKKTEERQAQLLKIQGISQQDYDLSLLNVNNLKADIDIIKANISKTRIYAPYDGKLGLKNVSPGAYVTPATVLTTISQVNDLKLDFTVPEKYTSMIKTGMQVHFSVEGHSNLFTARVMATEAQVSENTRSLHVRALVHGDNRILIPGAFATVHLDFDPDNNALMIPTQAVIPQARTKKVIRFEGGNAKFYDVVTGVRDSAYVQITEGLSAGDTVVITGLLSIKPDSKIHLGKIVNQ
ncbi:MAG TPA: efflux RND transporter periplasmic adaptor subunit [Chitinophagaceae bacterium]|nr:efflux RND transporter periplasmic adaptor subunit [Chitinophagaceae bacterium]